MRGSVHVLVAHERRAAAVSYGGSRANAQHPNHTATANPPAVSACSSSSPPSWGFEHRSSFALCRQAGDGQRGKVTSVEAAETKAEGGR